MGAVAPEINMDIEIIELTGDVNHVTVIDFEVKLIEARRRKAPVVIDLSRATYLCGELLEVLKRDERNSSKNDPTVAVVARPACQKVWFEDTKMTKIVSIFTSRDEAIADLTVSSR